MRDIPLFTVTDGMATLILHEIPFRKEAYVWVRSLFGSLDGLMQECAGFCRAAGAEVELAGLVRDDVDLLRETIARAREKADVVLVSGGSSAGMRDHTVDIFTSMPESELLVHGAAISPGKPFILARSGEKCLMGLPGHVGAALITARAFLQPLLLHL